MQNEQTIPLVDGPAVFAGAVSLHSTKDSVQPWRLVHDDLPLYEPALQLKAADPAGVRLTLISDTSSLSLYLDPSQPLPDPCGFDLLVDGKFHERINLPDEQSRVQFTNLPQGEHRLEVYLSQRSPVRIKRLTVDANATAKRWNDTRPKWLVYGSSITQCGAAAGPSETWPALVANRFDLNLTCMGFGGSCHLEPVVIRTLRDLPADYISLCLGINMYGGSSYSPRTFRAAVLGTIITLRDGHPNTPMAVVSPILSSNREDLPNAATFTLKQMRQTVHDAVTLLQERGDQQLHLIDGLNLFGQDFAHHMPDNLHPDAQGYRVLADQYAKVVMPAFKLKDHALTN